MLLCEIAELAIPAIQFRQVLRAKLKMQALSRLRDQGGPFLQRWAKELSGIEPTRAMEKAWSSQF